MRSARTSARAALCLALVAAGLVFAPSVAFDAASAQRNGTPGPQQPPSARAEHGVYQPTRPPVTSAPPINFGEAARQEALEPQALEVTEIRSINPPQARPEWFENRGNAGRTGGGGDDEPTMTAAEEQQNPQPPAPAAQGSSPTFHKTFPGESLTSTSIPPDTMGAVGPNHVVTVSNNQINIRTRDGALISRMTLNAFWAGLTLEGGITTPFSTFDPKILYDRFNDRFSFFTSVNSPTGGGPAGVQASSVLFAVTQTGDPTGLWHRSVFDADPTATGGANGAGRWADYPTIGQTKDWIIANYNVFNYTCNATGTACATTTYYGPYIYVIPKTAAYAGAITTANLTLFQDSSTNCTAPFEGKLGCGFTMAPAVNEDNTTAVNYLVEDWDSFFGQLRVSKITGPVAAPVLTVGTQFPQAPFNWRFNAARIGTSGGYVPQRDSLTFAPSVTSRIMANDSRINNAVYRNGSLWASHHIQVGAAPTPPGTSFGTANPDIRTAAQWWEIDPAVEAQPDAVTGLGTPPTQRGRIEDLTADNCNSGSSINVSTERTPCTMRGQFFIFVAIAVNKDNDVLLGFTQSSALTYPSGAYAVRLAADPANTMRDVVVYRSGASNYNLGGGAAGTTARQNRWGDYSMSVTDPVNDTDFWTVQEFSETRQDFGIGIAAPWATWWAQVKPNAAQPSNTGNLIISEFRPRGPGGPSDEFVELYNPSATTPVRVASVDNTEGWTLASNNGTTTRALTTIPQGVVVQPRGTYLIANSPVNNATGAATLYYSLRNYPGASVLPSFTVGGVRTATADTGYSTANPTTDDAITDNGGVAVFKSTDAAAGLVAANQVDAAGFAGAGTTFREGTGIPAITPGAVTGQITFVRNQSSGTPQDTNNNANDFLFLNTLATTETLGATPLLGAPGPENVDSPRLNNSVFVDRFDQSTGVSNPPNRFRDLTPVTNGSAGTVSFRRRVTNYTGAPVTRLRFRIRQITTYPAPAGVADLRALTSGDITVNGLPVKGTTVEEPPTQPNGGGWNTTWMLALSSPLAPGAFVDVQYVVGVMQGGSFSIFINTEALP